MEEKILSHREFIRQYQDQEKKIRYKLTLEISQLGKQEPYFSFTGDIYEQRPNGAWVNSGGGAIGEEVCKQFPEFRPFERWHLFSINSGPMHYIANAVYFWELATGRKKPGTYDRGKDYAAVLKNHIIYGAAPSFDNLDPVEDIGTETKLRQYLESRMSELKAAFDADMNTLFSLPSEPAQKTETPAELFIRKAGLTMTCEPTATNPHISGKGMTHYKCCLKANNRRQMTVHFSLGAAYTTEPTITQVIECLLSDAESIFDRNFESWADDLGYDPDSRQAEKIYQTIEKQAAGLSYLISGQAIADYF